ncbi:YiiX/YebB-like N1pC/P60 family cysteine hydrolase [Henriciella sp. AS95]|uniref:YiiX/YebB-like N1pC/P60 family cysteine hydrolase n=1 Tax=Henriciella sp. AS95 TaxID=3135782 RepID=UPI003170DD20
MALMAIAASAEAEPAIDRGQEMTDAISPYIQPGDLIFKGASTAVWTELAARWSTGDKRWGHVGIVVSVPETCCDPISVVHADTGGGAPGETIGEVRSVSLEGFLSDVDQAGVFRLNIDQAALARMIAYADGQARAHTPFDRGYSIESENNLYCTELIWRAMTAGLGHDPIGKKSTSLGRVYIALSDLSLHPLAQEVRVVEARN